MKLVISRKLKPIVIYWHHVPLRPRLEGTSRPVRTIKSHLGPHGHPVLGLLGGDNPVRNGGHRALQAECTAPYRPRLNWALKCRVGKDCKRPLGARLYIIYRSSGQLAAAEARPLEKDRGTFRESMGSLLDGHHGALSKPPSGSAPHAVNSIPVLLQIRGGQHTLQRQVLVESLHSSPHPILRLKSLLHGLGSCNHARVPHGLESGGKLA
mmetsp:Transcript_44764/g.101300  ORF Transcript_44764/g.101300 Transcript_44764/m.101300 type:complete len:210 (+) Transcript_44764:664-1293(+)